MSTDAAPAAPSSDAAAVVARMDRDTRIRLLSGVDRWRTEAVEELGVPHVVLADGPHGVRREVGATERFALAEAAPATCFPPAVTLGSSWDAGLAEEVGAALGAEARAVGVDVLLGPGLNCKRHPAGGRNFEYLSEDPVLSGRMAAALIRGIQSTGVGACAKHLVANNQEHFRMRVDAVVDQRTLRELYLRGFEIAVTEGRPWTVMSAYNKVNGEHAGESRRLLTDILRGEWGFDGLVMSDWNATADRAAGVHAGMDLEMPSSRGAWDAEVEAALDAGTLSPADLDTAVTRLVELAQRVGSAASAAPVRSPDDDHHELARRAAAAGTVLLTNDGTLPLRTDQRIGVVGALASTPRFQGGGSSRVTPTRVDDLLSSLRTLVDPHGGTVVHAAGYDAATGEATAAQVAEAVRVAAAADVVVVVVGLPDVHESEGFDRADLALPPAMDDLVTTLAAVNERTVVVLQNGAPVALPWADQPAAVLEAWLGGQAGGSALADVLTGAVEPGGRLAESFPVDVTDLPADADFADHPTRVVHRETLHVGYRFHDTFGVAPRFAFGHGLGYTTWELGEATVAGEGTDLTVTVPVTNTGERRGKQVVQLYVHDVEASVHRPEQELQAFAVAVLGPGETAQVALPLDRRSFAVWDVATGTWAVEAGTYELRLGTSSRDIAATVTVEVASDDVVTPVPAPAGAVATDEELAALGTPVPPPLPLLPFHRDSAVADLDQTVLGRAVRRVLTAAQARMLPEPPDEVTARLVEAATREAPLRTLATGAGGPHALPTLDRALRLLNAAAPGAARPRPADRGP